MIDYIIWKVSPEIFEGIHFFRWYGLCWLLGTVVGYRIMLRIYKTESIPVNELDKLAVYAMVGAVVGARLGHILFYSPSYYWENPVEILPFKFNPSFEFTGFLGLASHGGVLGALLGLYWYVRKCNRNYWWLLDRVTIAGSALGAFIRFGNLMNSEIIGTQSNLPWAFVFEDVDQIPRHPTQLYEALFYGVICAILFWIWKSKRFEQLNGFIAGLGITLIFTQRLLMEFLKENQVSFEDNFILNMGQILSIPLILAGIVLMIWKLKQMRLLKKQVHV